MTATAGRPRVTLVAALGRNRVIGRDGSMPWHLPNDLAQFRSTTLGHTIVMGRRTWDSIGRALPGRVSVVVTRQPGWSAPGALVAHSLPEALALVTGPEVFVVGGGEIYREALPMADRLLLSHVDADPEGDTHFPDVDPRQFAATEVVEHDGFTLVTYERMPAAAGSSRGSSTPIRSAATRSW